MQSLTDPLPNWVKIKCLHQAFFFKNLLTKITQLLPCDSEELWLDIDSTGALEVSEGGAVKVSQDSLLASLLGK